MFKENGELFTLPLKVIRCTMTLLPKRAHPTALAEMFGDHMVVNGKIWPKVHVEPRKYRLRLLNGCDSRCLVTQFAAEGLVTSSALINFVVIGGDQGLASEATETNTLVIEPAGRYDIVSFTWLCGASKVSIAVTNPSCLSSKDY